MTNIIPIACPQCGHSLMSHADENGITFCNECNCAYPVLMGQA